MKRIMVRQLLKLPVTDVQFSNIEVAIEWEVADEELDNVSESVKKLESGTGELLKSQQKQLMMEGYNRINDEAHGIIDAEATKKYQEYKKEKDEAIAEARKTIIELKSKLKSNG